MNCCKVKNCRYNNSHTTAFHQCGKCSNYGHGIMECDNDSKNNLKQYYNDVIHADLQCKILMCIYPHTHTTETHKCKYCNKMGHNEIDCNINVFDDIRTEFILDYMDYDIIKIKEILTDNTYMIVYEGLGNMSYIRKHNNNVPLEGLYLGVDDMYDINKINRINKFITNFKEIILPQMMIHDWNPHINLFA